MKDKISVIVPIYNSEKYLERCLDSLIQQTYDNLEILLINDGSTDTSQQICEDYLKKDNRIKLYNKVNGGLSSARNLGLKEATGNFIGFVDSDDWIAADMYEILYNNIIKYNADAAEVKMIKTDNYKKEVNSVKSKLHIYEGEKIKEFYLKYLLKTGDYSFCPCLFRKELFTNYKFREGMINTDLDDKYRIILNAKRYVFSTVKKYFYFQNPKSLTRDGLKNRDFNVFTSLKLLKSLVEGESIKINRMVQIKEARTYFSLLAKIAYFGFYDKFDEEKVIHELLSNLRSNYWLLMISNIPINRKIMITLICINFRLFRFMIKIYQNILGK